MTESHTVTLPQLSSSDIHEYLQVYLNPAAFCVNLFCFDTRLTMIKIKTDNPSFRYVNDKICFVSNEVKLYWQQLIQFRQRWSRLGWSKSECQVQSVCSDGVQQFRVTAWISLFIPWHWGAIWESCVHQFISFESIFGKLTSCQCPVPFVRLTHCVPSRLSRHCHGSEKKKKKQRPN